MKAYIFYFAIRGSDWAYCVSVDPKNQISTNHNDAREFQVEDLEEVMEFILQGFREAWEEVPGFRDKPEWKGASFKEIQLRSSIVKRGSHRDGGTIHRTQPK